MSADLPPAPQTLPAVFDHSAIVQPRGTPLVPALIADAGDRAGWRYVEFFAANIRNANTRRAYARACATFFAWCEERGRTLTTIRSVDGRRGLSNCRRRTARLA